MIAVSNGWKAAHGQTLLPEMFVKITYTATEPGLQQLAEISGNYAEADSDVGAVVSVEKEVGSKYSMLDYGSWGLDGSYDYRDSTYVDPLYVDRNYSSDDGSMSTYPTLTIEFDEIREVSIPGLTITWDDVFNGWATDFRVTAYNGSVAVARKTVTGNHSVVSAVWMDMVGYNRVTVEVLKWSHPYQRVRCSDIRMGIQTIYTKTDLMSYDHSQFVDLLSAELPKNTISFSLRNDDGRWNPDNPTGSEQYLLERQEIQVQYGMDVNGHIEWIKGGTFWLSEWSTPSNGMEATFTARDAVEFMVGIYTGPRIGTLYDVAVAALEQADLPVLDDGSPRYLVDMGLQNITTDFSGDDEYSIAEMLQMVAHAACCVFYQDRDGVIHIEPRSTRYSGYVIDKNVSYAHPEYTINKPLKAVSVAYGEETALVDVNSRGEVQTVDNPLIITEADALRVGGVAAELLKNRKVISGEFRADVRLDALDNIVVTSKYASNVIQITDIKYSTTGGAFKGAYTGRVVSVDLDSVQWYTNEIYVGEVD